MATLDAVGGWGAAGAAPGLAGVLSRIEQVGAIGAAMADRALSTICNHLNRHSTTAALVFAEIDADGSGELDAAELQV